MRFFAWLIGILVFVVLLVLALNNTQDATLNLFLGRVWTAPLILIGFAFFAAGLLAGLLSATPAWFRHKMENGRLRRELKKARTTVVAPDQQPPLM